MYLSQLKTGANNTENKLPKCQESLTQKIKAKIHAQEAENQQRPYLLCDSALPLPVALSPLRSRELGLLIPVLTISMLTGHYQSREGSRLGMLQGRWVEQSRVHIHLQGYSPPAEPTD